MFRFPFAIRHYYHHNGFAFAAAKAEEFATKKMTKNEVEWLVNYCRRIPFKWQEERD